MSGYATTQKILHVSYFWSLMFKDYITIVWKFHNFQIYDHKTQAPLAPLHLIIAVGPFAKWGIDFVTCNPHSAGGHGYIILVVNYFTKWAKVMPTYKDDRETAAIFIFNHVISWLSVPQAIVTDHDSHFCNFMMVELSAQLGLHHDNSTPYYPQANG